MVNSLFYMRRGYRRTASRFTPRATGRVMRYCNENVCASTNGTTIAPTVTNKVSLIPAAHIQGMRKIKGLTLTFDLTTSTYTAAAGVAVPPLVWAVVYVPEGFPPTALKLSTAAFGNEDPKLGDPQPNTDPRVSLFEPNQNVMGSGVLDLNFQQSQIYRIRSSRLLNSGDSIFLLLMNAGLAVNGAAAPSLVLQGSILCSYAIGI